jgi:hypothetical protein
MDVLGGLPVCPLHPLQVGDESGGTRAHNRADCQSEQPCNCPGIEAESEPVEACFISSGIGGVAHSWQKQQSDLWWEHACQG